MAGKAGDIALELLRRAFPAEDAERKYIEKVTQRPLYLKPTIDDEADARTLRSRERARKAAQLRKKQKPKPLSAREKRALCIYDIPKDQQKYALFVEMNRMWVAYIQEVLGENCVPVSAAAASRLVSADFHGAELEVVRSRCVSRVGLKGI